MKQTIPFRKDITFKTKIGELTAISLDNDLTLKGEDLIVGNFYISGNYKMLETSMQEEEYSYKIPCEIAISDEYDTYDATIDIDDFYYEIINEEILRVNIILVINNLERKEKLEEFNLVKEETIEVLTDEEPKENPEENKKEEIKKDKTEDREEETKQEKNDENKTNQKLQEETKEALREDYSLKKETPVFKDEIKLPLEEVSNDTVIIDKMDYERSMSFYEAKENAKKQSDTYLTYKVYVYKEEDTIEKVLEKYSITREQLCDYNNIETIVVGSKLVIPSSND